MSSPTTALPPAAVREAGGRGRPREVDNRAAYVSFGLAYLLGHGTAAVSRGPLPCSACPTGCP